MQFDEFIATVQEQGVFDRAQAVTATRATLQTLAERITGGEATDLASELPQEIAAFVHETAGRDHREAEIFDADEFCRRVASREGDEVDLDTAGQHAAAVMAAVRAAISDGEFSDVLGQLPPDIRGVVS
ncbi:MAG: DUF2267 domain-containing protein [Actinomycetota bacterium]|nr:DUF2267 domain-containing protein [Actinomycetota bacterium]